MNHLHSVHFLNPYKCTLFQVSHNKSLERKLQHHRERKSSNMAKFLIILLVLVLILMAISEQARAGTDDECFRKCSSGCVGRFRAVCVSLCARRCKLPLSNSDSEASESCILRCTKSTNFTSGMK